jgi:hypothetical protein
MAVTDQEKQTGIEVELIGQDGNAFMVMGLCKKALDRHYEDLGITREEKDELWHRISEEMQSGDYDNLLATAMAYFEVV